MSTSNPTQSPTQSQTQATRHSSSSDTQSLPGWLAFAGTLLAIGGIFGIIDGIAMVSKSKIYIEGTTYMFGNLNAWGWTFIVIGAIQVLVAIGVFAANRLAVLTGVFLASVYIIAELIAAAHFPLWSLVLIALQVMVIYGLIHGSNELEEQASSR